MPTDYAIKDGRTVFDATLYSGNGSTQTVTNAGGFKPDLVWIKNRGSVGDNGGFDSVRGTTKRLISNSTAAEDTISGVTAFNSNGFTLGADYNVNAASFVGWQWKAGGTAVSNTAGSITSSVSANTAAGFSIVTWTATGSAATIGHGLGVAPSMVIIKARSGAGENWLVYHKSLGTQYVILNGTNAAATNANIWNAAPNSTVVSYGASMTSPSVTYVAYCWSEVAGFSKFGSYVGNNSADGPFVYTGFRPKYVMYKRSDGGTESWRVLDTGRSEYNLATYRLSPNETSAEGTNTGYNNIDFLSNGFKVRSNSSDQNASGATYIYICFAENPFKYANAR